ncbi:MAG: AI-2E family transporter, partial [Clostridia bacterium]
LAQIPQLMEQGRELLARVNTWLVATGLTALPENNNPTLQDASRTANNLLRGAMHAAGSMAERLGQLALWPLLTFYFLRDRERFCHRLAMWIPIRHRRIAVRTAAESRRALLGYLRGQMVVAGVVGVLTAVGLLIIGVPAWLALGMLMALLDLIPYFGPLLGTIPILLFSAAMGWQKALWALAMVLVVQQIEGNIIAPRVIGDSTGLHPVTVILSLTAGNMVWGPWGMLLALPVVVAGRAAIRVLSAGE